MLYIFDMGGVLLHGVFELKAILEEQNCSIDIQSLYLDDLMESLSAGSINEEEYWTQFNQCHGTSVESTRWGKTFAPQVDSNMESFIRELRASGHRVVCGTNTFDAHYQVSVKQGDYDCFDQVYASHLMGVAKPHPQFWQSILEAEGFEPHDAVFIDDFETNVAAAATLGIKSYVFRDLPHLQEELIQATDSLKF
ncbi:MAG: HAD-IA family hydrolase [Spirochaetales bacterium]|nr:HAD-IA family hydrolase [Spirochaetales bacterium]